MVFIEDFSPTYCWYHCIHVIIFNGFHVHQCTCDGHTPSRVAWRLEATGGQWSRKMATGPSLITDDPDFFAQEKTAQSLLRRHFVLCRHNGSRLLPHPTASWGRDLLDLHLPISFCSAGRGVPHLSRAPTSKGYSNFFIPQPPHLLHSMGPQHVLVLSLERWPPG